MSLLITPPHSGTESSKTQNARLRRRSQRLKIVVPVDVITNPEKNDPARQEAQAIYLNAHGAMLLLQSSVEEGQLMRLINRRSLEEQEVRVISISSAEGEKWAVGVEFTRSAAGFWQISFPGTRTTPSERS